MMTSGRDGQTEGTIDTKPAATGSRDRGGATIGPVTIVCGTISVTALFILCGVMVADVVARYLFVRPFSWSGEVVKFLMSIIFFAALPIATVRSDHIVVDVLSRRFVGKVKFTFALVASLVSASLMALFAWYGFDFAERLMKYGDRTFSLGLPLHYAAWAAAAAFAVSAIAYLWRAWAVTTRRGD